MEATKALYDEVYNVAYCHDCAEKKLGEPETRIVTVKELKGVWFNDEEANCSDCNRKIY
jgi:hypothetical protein